MQQTYCPHRIPFTQFSVRDHGLRVVVREKFVSETSNSRVNMSGVIRTKLIILFTTNAVFFSLL
jgi:hypothetical protein